MTFIHEDDAFCHPREGGDPGQDDCHIKDIYSVYQQLTKEYFHLSFFLLYEWLESHIKFAIPTRRQTPLAYAFA